MQWENSILETLEWGNNISNKEKKLKIADKIASMVANERWPGNYRKWQFNFGCM